MSVRGPQQLREIKRKAERQGWKITVTNSSHLKWVPPDASAGCVITSGSRLARGRSIENTIARLKSKGLRL